jgi:predicted amidohydrolase YtcJ
MNRSLLLSVVLLVAAAVDMHSQTPLQLQQIAYLKASNAEANDHFGCGGENQGHNGQGVALSADGRTLAVGAPHESSAARGINGSQSDNSVFDAGAVYVFTRVGDRWTQQAYVKPSNPRAGAEFGHYVALSADGNTLAVSAYWEPSSATGINGNQRDESIPQAGAIYVFTRTGSQWTQQAYIKASNTGEAGTADSFGEGDQFGWSLALSGDGNTIAVGAITEDSGSSGINGDQRNNSAQGAGAVYVFTRAGNSWAQHAYVKPSNVDAGDMFGYAVALSRDGSTLAATSFDEDGSGRGINPPPDNRNAGSGAVYVFARVAAAWSQQAYIKPSNSEPQDSFGVHVAMSDDGATLLVGSLDEDCPATGVNPRGCDSDWNSDLSMGAAYVFARTGSTWSQQAFLKASNTGANDWFGARVALSGDGNTAAIGAPFEDGGAKGVNGRQDDDSASQAGAVYLFSRTGAGAGAAWQQRAYVKGSNTEAFDEFGSSVALDRTGATLVASARGEDGATRGANGNQASNTADEAGAVYVFAIGGAARGADLVRSAPSVAAQQRQPDLILTNGKIVTVDDRFSIAEAVAIGDFDFQRTVLDGEERGRITAVGTTKEIEALAGPKTRRIDLRGKTVIPGLIDNHMHLLRAATTWQREVRWDGVPSRRQALDLLLERVKASRPGEWIYTLGGWTLEQFADDPRPFTKAELDRVAPDNPVFLQASYYRGYFNTRGAEALGLDRGVRLQPDFVDEANLRGVAARLPVATGDELASSARQLIADLNRVGVTSVGSAACEQDVMTLFVQWSTKGSLNMRVHCIKGQAPATPDQVTAALPRIAQYRVLWSEDPFINDVAYGETVYGPLHDPMFVRASDPQPEQLVQWRRVATEVAKAKLPLHVHANLTATIGAFLDQIELINREYPIRDLRWTLAHVNQIDASHLARMKALGMSAAVHPWAVINGGINRTVFGSAALDMAPLRTLQASGVRWGLGSDGTRANQILPFQTLSWAITGRMVGGEVVLNQKQRLSRQEALVAHTRSNAYLLFQEKQLGSIEVGKRADLAVLDRDYLTVPDDQIKDIRSVMTIVHGRIAYEAK